ncbi:MAG TPA: hypothetical protein VN982_07525 [Candidatus Dormibacteraeota bacterium]|nr:hypothetical protein [Candidatus Dormibacteraeota bacterium]
MPAAHHRKAFPLFFLCLFLCGSRAAAQSSLDPAQLPSRTLFYFLWRGTPPPDSRKTNSLLSLWDDPDFAPVRSALFQSMTANSSKENPSSTLSSEEATEYSTLLDNAFLVGFVGEPKPHRSAASASAPASTPWNGVFLIYDRSGKEALLAKALLRTRAQGSEIPKLTPFVVAGIPALKAETKSGSTYWAETGKFAVSAKERSVFEEILTRVAGKSTDTFTLAQNTYYQEALPTLGKGFIEAFLRVADLREIIDTSNPSSAQVASILDAVKLNSFHSLAFHLSLEGARTRVQGSLLGDTSKGTLFDIFAEGQQNPPSFAYLTPETVYFQETELNLPGMYESLNRILRTSLAPNQQGGTDMIDALAKQRLGMPLQEALGVATGEFGSLQTSPVLDPNKQIYFFGIHKKPEALKLLRSIFAERITSERNEGSITYLKISLQASQTAAGVAQWHFYHLAVTPDIILAAPQSESLRAVLVPKPLATSATPFPNAPAFLAIRAQYPDKIHGFSYFDFQKLDWPAVKQKYLEIVKTSSNNRPANAKATPSQEPPAWLIRLNPQIVPRHIHTSSSASWKDAKGVHFDEWLE